MSTDRAGGRRRLLLPATAAALALLALLHPLLSRWMVPYRRPVNVLLVTPDLLRSDRVWPLARRPVTPELRWMAQNGLRCSDARCQSELTQSTAQVLLHGRYLSHIDDSSPSLSRILQARGYQTGAFVSSEVFINSGLSSGFDTFDTPRPGVGLYGRDARETTSRALTWLSRRGSDHPWFCWVMYWGLHFYQTTPERLPIPGDRRLPDDMDRRYDEVVRCEDDCLGRLLAWLRASGRDSDTLVVVTGLHGIRLIPNGSRINGLYDFVLKVPLVLWAPGALPHGRVVTGEVGHVDLMATILSLIGVPAPTTDGMDISRRDPPPDRVLYAETTAGEGRAVYQGRWAYVEYDANFDAPSHPGVQPEGPPDPARPGWWILRPRGTRELFDLQRDPEETANLAKREPVVAATLESRLHGWERSRVAARKPTPRPLSPALERDLIRYGYAPDKSSTAPSPRPSARPPGR